MSFVQANTDTLSIPQNKNYVEVITSLKGLVSIKDKWDNLQERCEINIPFITYDWYYAWWRNFSPDSEFTIITIYEDETRENILAILPVYCKEKKNDGKKVLSLWANTHSFRTGLLCDYNNHHVLDSLTSYLSADMSWNVIYIPYLVSGTETGRLLKQSLLRNGLKYIITPGMSSPALELQGNWDEYFKKMSRSSRETLRRKTRKLLEKSDGSVKVYHGMGNSNDEIINTKLKECWQISSKTWKHAAGSSIAADAQRVAFYEEIANNENGWIVLAILYKKNMPIAFEYNLLHNSTLYNMKLGYDEEYKKYSPGIVLRLKMLEWAFNNPDVKYFDYMGNTADYKAMFSTYSVEHENIEIYAKGLKNDLYVLYKGSIYPFLVKHLRPIKRLIRNKQVSA